MPIPNPAHSTQVQGMVKVRSDTPVSSGYPSVTYLIAPFLNNVKYSFIINIVWSVISLRPLHGVRRHGASFLPCMLPGASKCHYHAHFMTTGRNNTSTSCDSGRKAPSVPIPRPQGRAIPYSHEVAVRPRSFIIESSRCIESAISERSCRPVGIQSPLRGGKSSARLLCDPLHRDHGCVWREKCEAGDDAHLMARRWQ